MPRLPTLQYLSGKFIGSPPFPQFNVVYHDEFVIARFQHCREGREFTIPVMSLLIFSEIACQRICMLADPGVARTFVVYCRLFKVTPKHTFHLLMNRFVVVVNKVLTKAISTRVQWSHQSPLEWGTHSIRLTTPATPLIAHPISLRNVAVNEHRHL